jgi:hypothetical protein
VKAIYKYEITPEGRTEMPVGAEVLSVGAQGEVCVAWALVSLDAPTTTRRLIAVPTGSKGDADLGPKRSQFVGTIQRQDGLVFHIFDAGERS